MWQTAGNGQGLDGYAYTYDGANRLKDATFKEFSGTCTWTANHVHSERNINYDANGNILSLTRSTQNAINYQYDATKPNRLLAVRHGLNDVFTYDNNGNMLTDSLRGTFNYDYRNMPLKVATNDTVIEYAYNAAGQRIKKKFNLNGALLDSVIYVRNGSNVLAEYRNGQLDHFNIYGNGLIGKLAPTPKSVTISQTVSGQTITAKDTVYIIAGGRINSESMVATVGNGSNSDKRYYYLQDHLGSIRVVLNEQGNVDSWSDYYPFGKESRGSSTSNEPKEQFTGKERDIEIGLDYFGTRYYNAEIGRWTSKDPLAEKYPSLSPYHYSNNNPVLFVDFDGRDFGVKVDHDSRSITITATYYVAKGDVSAINSAKAAVDLWNSQSDKYCYEVSGKTKTNYDIKFDLNVQETDDVMASWSNDRLNNEPGNAYFVKPDDDQVFQDDDADIENGKAIVGSRVYVKESRQNSSTGPHEIGHSLGLEHFGTGIMTSESSNKLREPKVIWDNVSRILKGGFKGKSDHKAARSYFKQTGKSPRNFTKGNVKEKEEENDE